MKTQITVQELATLIKKVRLAQKTFFRNRSKENLKASIKLEERLDEVLKDIPDEPEGFF